MNAWREENRSASLTANQLKLIAIVAMVVDHCAIVFVPESFPVLWLFRMIGRITAPIMCYFIAEGYYHTSDLKRYMGRILMIAVIAHIPHNLCFGHAWWKFWEATDVMVSLLMGLVALALWKKEEIPWILKFIGLFVCCILSYSADWNYIAVFWILGFGVFHGNKQKQLLAMLVVTAIYLIQPFIYGASVPYISRFGVLFVIPLLLQYSGKRGRQSKLIKWGFYWFYPIHLFLIYIIGQVLQEGGALS